MTLTEFIDTWIPPWVIGTIIMIVPAVVVLVIYRWFTLCRGSAQNSSVISQLGRFSCHID
jgi:xanthine/uracil permease